MMMPPSFIRKEIPKMINYITDETYEALKKKCVCLFHQSDRSFLEQFYNPQIPPDDIHKLFQSRNVMCEPVILQEKTGYCWLIAALNCISSFMREKYSIENATFQIRPLIFYDKLEKANLFLENILHLLDVPIYSREVQYCLKNSTTDKGQWAMAENLICKYGLIPTENEEMKYAPLKTGELNGILSYLLKHAAFKMRKKQEDKCSLETLMLYKERVLAEIYQLLVCFLGAPPQKISVPPKYLHANSSVSDLITPIAFFQKYINFPFSEYISICNYGDGENSNYINYVIAYDGNVYEGKKNSFFQLPYEVFHESVFQQVNHYISTWIACDAGKFVLWNQGILDDSNFKFLLSNGNNLLDEISRDEIVDYSIANMSHAMTMCDCINNNDDEWWYAKNSVGMGFGKNGFCCISKSWFEHYIYQAVVQKRFLPLEVRDKLENTKNVLPWEFFRHLN